MAAIIVAKKCAESGRDLGVVSDVGCAFVDGAAEGASNEEVVRVGDYALDTFRETLRTQLRARHCAGGAMAPYARFHLSSEGTGTMICRYRRSLLEWNPPRCTSCLFGSSTAPWSRVVVSG